MYRNLTNEMKDSFKPLMNMFDIQSRTAQKLLREQMDFMSECLDVGTRHADELRDSQSAGKFFSVPVETGREIGERWTSVAGRQWSVLMEARDALTGEVKTAAQEAESTVKQASAEAEASTPKTAPKSEATAGKTGGSAARKN